MVTIYQFPGEHNSAHSFNTLTDRRTDGQRVWMDNQIDTVSIVRNKSETVKGVIQPIILFGRRNVVVTYLNQYTNRTAGDTEPYWQSELAMFIFNDIF